MAETQPLQLTVGELADRVDGRVEGAGAVRDLMISGVQTLDAAQTGHISFVSDEKYAPAWDASKATAVLVPESLDLACPEGKALIRVKNVDLSMARVLAAFAPPRARPKAGVHPTAIISPTATHGSDVHIGPGVFIGDDTHIGTGCILHANVTIYEQCRIGQGGELHSGTVIRERCTIGDRVIIHPNVTVGSDGFGYRPSEDGRSLVKIPQIGTVEIGDDVELGAGTCIDRGKFGATKIGDMSKLDNLCHVAHNCILGKGVILAGQVGMAGSVTIGDGVVMGGQVALRDHITIGRGAQIAGRSAVMDDVPDGAKWAGFPAQDARLSFREVVALRKLPELVRELRKK